MVIKNIFFDLDDTLFPTAQFAELARKNAIRSMIQHGLKADFDYAYKKLIEIIKLKGSNYNQHFNLLCKYFNKKIDYEIIASGLISYHNAKNTILPFANTYSTLLTLKEHSYKLFIATNGNPIKQWEKVLRLNIDTYFDAVFISEEVGMLKSAVFFKKILKRTKTNAAESVMIGNNLDIDVYPALGAGMKAILVDHYDRFEGLKNLCSYKAGVYFCSVSKKQLYEMGFCSSRTHEKCKNKDFLIINNLEKVVGAIKALGGI